MLDIFFLSIGSICSMLYVLRLYQNFLLNKVVYRDSTQKNNNDDKRKLILKISYIFNRIRSNIFELMGFLLPFIITSVILKSLDYLLIFYFILFFLDFFIAAFRHLSILK